MRRAASRTQCKTCKVVGLRTPREQLGALLAGVDALGSKPSAAALQRLQVVRQIIDLEQRGTCVNHNQRLLRSAVSLLGRKGAAAQVEDAWLKGRILLGYEPGAEGARIP